MICKICNYEWISRIMNPKSCPRCKRRFDYVTFNVASMEA